MMKRKTLVKKIALFALFTLVATCFISLTACKRFNKPVSYKIIYELNGGTNSSLNPSSYDGLSDVKIYDAVKQGFFFAGWSSGSRLPQRNYVIKKGQSGDLTLTAHFKLSPYSIKISGSDYGLLYYEKGETVDYFPVLEKPHYVFGGYYYDSDFTEAMTFPFKMPQADMTVYAKYTPSVYTVNYTVDGVKNSKKFTVEDSDFILTAPQKEGYTMLYWQGADGNKYYEISVKEGVLADLDVTAVYDKNKYSLTFDEMGGSLVGDSYFYFGDKLTAPQSSRDGYVFDGWYEKDSDLPFNFSAMPSRNVRLFARWYAVDGGLCTYKIPSGAQVDADFISGSSLKAGEKIHLTASKYNDVGRFDHWELNGNTYSRVADIEFVTNGGDCEFVPVYNNIYIFTYDKSVDGDLTLNLINIVNIIGEGITDKDYTVGFMKTEIKKSYLQKLDLGRHVYSVRLGVGDTFVCVDVTDSSVAVKDLKIDYDTHFPKVTLSFDEAISDRYQVSFNGSDFVDCHDGYVLSNYNKSVNNTVIVRNLTKGGYAQTSVIGLKQSVYSDLYNKSYTYNGETHDFIAFSKEEFENIIEYYSLVEMPTNYKGVNPKIFQGYFAIIGDYYDKFVVDPQACFQEAFMSFSASYVPSYSITVYNSESDYKYKFGVQLTTSNSFNDKKSATVKENRQDKLGLLKQSGRFAQFDDFKINQFKKSQKIRTIYELDELEYGVKPIFDGNGMAKDSYEAAKNILRKYVDDDMTDAQKVKVIYDYLALCVTYDEAIRNQSDQDVVGSYRCFTSYGALIDGVAVCDGIASAFKLMCLIEGIECREIIGTSSSVGHAWNKINLGGTWYGADATWAYRDGFVSHEVLFIDERALIDSGHVENGFLSEPYVETAADCKYDYYTLWVLDTSVGYNYIIDSEYELYFVMEYAMKQGWGGIEVKTTLSNYAFNSALSSCVSSLGDENFVARLTKTSSGVNYIAFEYN